MRSPRRTTAAFATIALAAASSTLPACTTTQSGKTEFHPEAILGVAMLGAIGVFAPETYKDRPLNDDFDRQWKDIERSQEIAHNKRR